MGFHLNIFATAEANYVKFGIQLGFAKAHHKIILTDKSGRGNVLGSREAPRYLAAPLEFSCRTHRHNADVLHN